MESGASPVQGADLGLPVLQRRQDGGAAGASAGLRREQSIARDTSCRRRRSRSDSRIRRRVAGSGYPSGGQNAANGVALYQPKPTEATAYLATCTLTAAQHDLCTAVLNHFAATFG